MLRRKYLSDVCGMFSKQLQFQYCRINFTAYSRVFIPSFILMFSNKLKEKCLGQNSMEATFFDRSIVPILLNAAHLLFK